MMENRLGLNMLTLDMQRMSEAMSRPGIDPRTWTTLAIVTAVHVSSSGIHVDIKTIAGIEETASVPTLYGGRGFGLYCPVAVDDWVLVVIPEGDWGAGARVIAQVWDAGSPPPQEAIDHPRDVALIVEPGQSLRIIVGGGGDVVIEARDGGQVKLGDESASRGVARDGDDVSLTFASATALQAALDGRYAIGNPAANLQAGTIVGSISSSSDDVKSS